MNRGRILCIIAVFFILSALFVVVGAIRSNRSLTIKDKNQNLSEQPIIKSTNIINKTTPQLDAINVKNTTLKQRDKKPQLNLKLLGTILGNTPIAYIKDLVSDRQRVCEIGDIISGAKIVDIQLGKVILERDGEREILVLADTGESASTDILSAEKVINKKEILKEIGNDISKAMSLAKVVPNFDFVGGKFSGLKVEGIKKGSLVEFAGLRNGDIIKVVNGQELSTQQKSIQVFRKVRNQPQINIGLLRKNRLIKLRYNIKD